MSLRYDNSLTFYVLAALSFYFLVTVRYGMRDEVFAKKCEPFIHFIVLSFSLSTAIGGVFMDVYHESETGTSCWVSSKPGEECWNDSCGAEKIAWIFGGLPNLLTFLSGKRQKSWPLNSSCPFVAH